MCGIAGIVAFTEKGKSSFDKMEDAIRCLNLRGPDAKGVFHHNRVMLGHTRLSIIDTSEAGKQPMTDASGRYTVIFNGEFFNYREHRQFVIDKGYTLHSESDTEVLLYLYMIEGEKCLQRINGFFALAIYDKLDETLFIARDRMGVKPLLVYQDEDRLFFASEMKSLVALGIPRFLDEVSLMTYLHLNYIPAPATIFKGVRKMMPGTFITLNMNRHNAGETVSEKPFYQIARTETNLSYGDQQKKLFDLLDAAVERRLVSDVPLGCFLSGGIDSSVVSALAARHTPHLKTFSIGFRDEPLFDETYYANRVAQKIGSDHTVFSLVNDDLFECLHSVLDYIDEPFADSSALNVYILSRHTRKHVTVALSGDGADELFGGYNKHAAELKIREGGLAGSAVELLNPLWKSLPQSRNSKTGNRIRQFRKFAEGKKLGAGERYWKWAGFASDEESATLLMGKVPAVEYERRKKDILKEIRENGDLNDIFLTDMHLVLVNDMLAKVDMMSMANSLEVRTPFLDYSVVDFAFSLPVSSKIDAKGRKKIVRDAFRDLLPEELYSRKKQGFEVPMLKWFRTGLKSMIADDLLSENLIREQGIFSYPGIKNLLGQLNSNSPGDAVARIWGLVVFQSWYKKYFKG